MINCYFQVQSKALIVRKGVHSHIESYSAFWDNAKLNETALRQDLRNRNVTDVFVCGIAYDHCVGELVRIQTPSHKSLHAMYIIAKIIKVY